MAIQDKRIDELAVASQIKETDLLVIEQNGVAKSVSGKVVNDFAADAAIRAGVALPTGGTVGQVLTKTASGANWQNAKTALPTGGENGFVLAKLNDGAEWVEAGTPTQAQTDSAVTYWLNNHPEATTTVQDGAITEQKLDPYLKAKVNGGGISNGVKTALLALLEKVAYIDENGQTYLNTLQSELSPPASLVSISAVFTQGSAVIYDTDDLDSLKQYLVVTANYDDASTETITNYTLSGTLNVGTSTITASYGGKSDTFNVTVSSLPTYYSISGENLFVGQGSISWDTTNDIFTNTTALQIQRRRFIYINTGKKPYNTTINNSTFTVTDPPQYPIPVPKSATSCTYMVTPNTQFVGASFYTYSNGKYERVDDVGWKQGSYTFTFNQGTKDFMTIALKHDSNGTSYPNEPTQITISFS